MRETSRAGVSERRPNAPRAAPDGEIESVREVGARAQVDQAQRVAVLALQHQDVGRLDVAMHELGGVQLGQQLQRGPRGNASRHPVTEKNKCRISRQLHD
jgi:hypothetical protein